MAGETKFEKVCFEPHGLFGGKDPDGNPWPFGYISTLPTPQPIFELSACLSFPKAELRSLALKMGAAPELYETASEPLVYIIEDDEQYVNLKIGGELIARVDCETKAGAALLRFETSQQFVLRKARGEPA